MTVKIAKTPDKLHCASCGAFLARVTHMSEVIEVEIKCAKCKVAHTYILPAKSLEPS